MTATPLTLSEVNRFRKDFLSIETRCYFNWHHRGLPLKPTALVNGRQNGQYSLTGDPYFELSKLLNCAQDEVAITGNSGTQAFKTALSAILPLQGSDPSNISVILLDPAMYASNVWACIQRQQFKASSTAPYQIVNMSVDEDGRLSPGKLKEQLINLRAEKVSIDLAALTATTVVGGIINPVSEICGILQGFYVPSLVDGVGILGQLPINVKEWGCDFATFSSQKYLCGPKGVGILYYNHEFHGDPFSGYSERYVDPLTSDVNYLRISLTDKGYKVIHYRPENFAFEGYTSNPGLKAKLGKALHYLNSIGMERTYARTLELAEYVEEQLRTVPGAILWGKDLTGVRSFNIDGQNFRWHNSLKRILRERFNVWVDAYEQSICPGWKPMPAVLRISYHWTTKKEEVDYLFDCIRQVVTHQSDYDFRRKNRFESKEAI